MSTKQYTRIQNVALPVAGVLMFIGTLILFFA